MNTWGKRSKREECGNKLKFLSCTEHMYNLDNDDLDDNEGLAEEEPNHPDLPAKIPGLDLEIEYMDPGPAI